MKHFIVSDLNVALAESKSSLDAEMAAAYSFGHFEGVVISGVNWPQYEMQLLVQLRVRRKEVRFVSCLTSITSGKS
ncbi:MAG: hypothetical protein ACI9HK_004825 [Pirellulaceae bacterium]|jgi:hypothetical protein